MITVRKSADRGHFNHGWLDTYHTFSFARYYDPKHMGFRSLRVINEDRVAPGRGFGEHPHDNMEIISYVVSGSLAHRDSAGNTGALGPGDVQHMTAGAGIEHSEFNGSKTEPVHFLQIWIEPANRGTLPGHAQANFSTQTDRNRLRPVATPDGQSGSLRINQDVRLFKATLDAGASVTHALAPGRYAWVQVIRGDLIANDVPLATGDGAAVSGETSLTLTASKESEFLLFDLA